MAANAVYQSSNQLEFDTMLHMHAWVSHLKSLRGLFKNVWIKKFLTTGTSTDFENARFEVEWTHARLHLLEPELYPMKEVFTDAPVSVDYTNVKAEIKATRTYTTKRKAMFSLMWKEGNTSGLGLRMQISLKDVLNLSGEERGLFGESFDLDLNKDFKMEHEIDDTLKLEIPIPTDHPGTIVTNHEEDRSRGNFTCRALLTGRITVKILDKKNEIIHTVTDDVAEVVKKLRKDFANINIKKTSNSTARSVRDTLAAFSFDDEARTGITWKVEAECAFTGAVRDRVATT